MKSTEIVFMGICDHMKAHEKSFTSSTVERQERNLVAMLGRRDAE